MRGLVLRSGTPPRICARAGVARAGLGLMLRRRLLGCWISAAMSMDSTPVGLVLRRGTPWRMASRTGVLTAGTGLMDLSLVLLACVTISSITATGSTVLGLVDRSCTPRVMATRIGVLMADCGLVFFSVTPLLMLAARSGRRACGRRGFFSSTPALMALRTGVLSADLLASMVDGSFVPDSMATRTGVSTSFVSRVVWRFASCCFSSSATVIWTLGGGGGGGWGVRKRGQGVLNLRRLETKK